ncbi:MAG: hypothetical protein LBJ15_12025 [Comamonas sp.]|jgi:hypothetical protein|uniref:hypothetical protein n=1 Tax=Comamonas sp. TaxID=34028 RepID=UPI002828C9BE|nr:hypothetical protein [Comamonas sp.]MDR0214719.1 hypothetical protein [Comamonas sp.]
MGIEYKIRFPIPLGFGIEQLQRKLPASEVASGQMPAYDFTLEADGFYFVDHLNDASISALAMRVLIDEALRVTPSVQISEL